MEYLKNLIKKENVITKEGKEIEIYELNVNLEDEILEEWANHFRSQYIDDVMLEMLIEGTGMTKQEWLLENKFPSATVAPGPSTRAGDFGELLVADYIEYILSYYVPSRIKYSSKNNPNTPVQGSDIIGLKSGEDQTPEDELFVIEVKTRASICSENKNRLQEAINHSKKDIERVSISLNAMKQRLIELNKIEESKKIQRFQNDADRPYKTIYGATAIYTTEMLDFEKIKEIRLEDETEFVKLYIIHIDNLMEFIHELYRRASLC